MPATPNSVSPSIPGPWWTAMFYGYDTISDPYMSGTIADFACRKAIFEFSISRHADTTQELQELAGWTPPGTETAGAEEGTESEHSKSKEKEKEGEKGKEKKPTGEGGAGPS
ncbi:hypothetical protein ASPTUDRAFT_69247 [Aspergillus tubingensis CBS 134.48]|uniref:Uncharacterized protein n=1 Tax=Aspergillus tubingensis (strain CBS 134.48) TaxID=767770 RepID=A0A1L9MUB6_ASPTC|nr:hypothetical protein ASPTUDRAFT_69247 [Aspergillus tubingensis CBS 134.48]